MPLNNMPTGIYLRTENHKQKIGEGLRKAWKTLDWSGRNKKLSITRKILCKINKPIPPSQKGIKRTDKFKKRLSELNKLGIIGFKNKENHYNWKGGKSFEPYPLDWTNNLKKTIRERDRYICQLCGEFGKTVHHINYDKKNCDENNLITTCKICSSKVNFQREKWEKIFQAMQFIRDDLKKQMKLFIESHAN